MGVGALWPSVGANSVSKSINGTGDKGKQDRVIEKMANQARDIAKTLAPHGKTGNLARTIFSRKVADCVYDVGSPLVYAWAVEYGSGVYGEGPSATKNPIEPKSAEYLAFRIGGTWMRVRFVLGQHPQPFLRPACEQVDSDGAMSGFIEK